MSGEVGVWGGVAFFVRGGATNRRNLGEGKSLGSVPRPRSKKNGPPANRMKRSSQQGQGKHHNEIKGSHHGLSRKRKEGNAESR